MSVRFRPDLQLPWTCDYSFVPKRKIALKETHRARARSRFGNEHDLLEAGLLHRIDQAADALVRRVHVAADMPFGAVKLGRASRRESGVREVLYRVGGGSIKKK